MIARVLGSFIGGLLAGVAAGVLVGWVLFPRPYTNSPASALDPTYRDEYTVMVATAYLGDSDDLAAVERLRVLGVANIPEYVQDVTERYISTSQRVNDIQALVALSASLGRLTPLMEPYRLVATPEAS
ncbi:MAG: hypothetical protein ACOYL5_08870 [Phototrophicaceae bacterium]